MRFFQRERNQSLVPDLEPRKRDQDRDQNAQKQETADADSPPTGCPPPQCRESVLLPFHKRLTDSVPYPIPCRCTPQIRLAGS